MAFVMRPISALIPRSTPSRIDRRSASSRFAFVFIIASDSAIMRWTFSSVSTSASSTSNSAVSSASTRTVSPAHAESFWRRPAHA